MRPQKVGTVPTSVAVGCWVTFIYIHTVPIALIIRTGSNKIWGRGGGGGGGGLGTKLKCLCISQEHQSR